MKKKRLVGYDLNGVATYEGDEIDYVMKDRRGKVCISRRTAKFGQRCENFYNVENLYRREILVKNEEAYLVKVTYVKTHTITYEVLDIYGKPSKTYRKSSTSETLELMSAAESYFESV